nr:hypothetical protein [Tanacetum cinerariifolium]
LVDLLGIDIVTQYYNKKLLYERYYENIEKRRQTSKIINYDVLTKKGPISLKELPAEFLGLPHLASLAQEKLRTLDSIPGHLKTVTNTLNMFATLVENASGATTTGVPSVDKITASPAEGIRMLIQT